MLVKLTCSADSLLLLITFLLCRQHNFVLFITGSHVVKVVLSLLDLRGTFGGCPGSSGVNFAHPAGCFVNWAANGVQPLRCG